jgi:beta-lactamase class A
MQLVPWLVSIPLVFTQSNLDVPGGTSRDMSPLAATFDRIVRASKSEVGVTLIHLQSGTRLGIHDDCRFAMASVYKLPIAVELLAQVSEGALSLDRPVAIGPNDIRACCNLSRRHPHGGVTQTLGELLELMIVESDNTAGDAVLKIVGGPPVVERRLRALGFASINVNRYEGDIAFEMTGVVNPPPPTLRTLELERRLIAAVSPAALRAARARYTTDPRDTATPNDMALLLARLQTGTLLPPAATSHLLELMVRAKTGSERLKALLPAGTVVAHKTGTTDVVINDVGIINLPADSATPGHLVLTVFVMNGASRSAMQQTIAKLSAAAFEFFTGRRLPPPPKKLRPARPKKRRS